MISSAYNQILGLDIGSQSIKLAFVKRKKGSFDIKLDEILSTTVENKLSPPDLSLLLKELIKRNKISSFTPTVLSVGGESTFIRTVKLPPLSKEKIDKIVQFEVRQQVPVSPQDLFWDYVLTEKEQRAFALIVAAKKSLVNERLHLIRQARIKAIAVGCDSVSIFNITQQSAKDLSFLIVDIGSHNTNLILYARKGLFAHSLPLGGAVLTSKIPQEDKIKEFMRDLTYHIKNSINFYKSQIDNLEIEKIILTGTGSLLEGMPQQIEKNLRIKTDYPEIPEEIRDKVEDKKIFLRFLVPIANALSVFKKDYFQINLIKHLLAEERLERQKNFYLSATAVCLTLIFILGFLFLREQYNYQKVYLETLKKQVSFLQGYLPRVEKVRKENFILTKKIELAKTSYLLKDIWLLTLADLSDSKPKDLWFTDFKSSIQDLAEGRVSLILTGRAYSYRILSNFISNLKKKKLFKNVNPQSTSIVKTEMDGKNIELVEFTLSIEI